jgi:hypothetical protein
VGLGVAAGATTGVLIVGAGGRLVMRVLAITAGDSAQGAVTEADEVVGDVTLSGTLGFILFVGLAGGVASGLLFVALHWWLPGGRWAGVCFGALLLVLFATRIEPLRTNNNDFDLVGPGWLAITLFAALALLQGAAIAAFAGRWSRTQPLLTTPRASLRYLPIAPILLAGFTVFVFVVIVATAMGVERLHMRRWIPRGAALVTGRVLLIVGALVALPSSVSAIVDIARRGP